MSTDQRFARAAKTAPLLLALALSAGCASEPADIPPASVLTTPLPLRTDAATVITPGETLLYDVKFGFLRVAELVFNVKGVDLDGEPGLRIEGITRPLGVATAFGGLAGFAHAYVKRATLRPESYLLSTEIRISNKSAAGGAARRVPLMLTASFEQERREVWSALFVPSVQGTPQIVAVKHLGGSNYFDPLTAMFLVRAIEPPTQPEDELRFLVTEGGPYVDLVTIRNDGPELLDVGEDEPAPCRRFRVRTDLLDKDGALAARPPQTNVFIWISDSPRREVLRLEGRTNFGAVVVTLRRPAPAESRPESRRTDAPITPAATTAATESRASGDLPASSDAR